MQPDTPAREPLVILPLSERTIHPRGGNFQLVSAVENRFHLCALVQVLVQGPCDFHAVLDSDSLLSDTGFASKIDEQAKRLLPMRLDFDMNRLVTHWCNHGCDQFNQSLFDACLHGLVRQKKSGLIRAHFRVS